MVIWASFQRLNTLTDSKNRRFKNDKTRPLVMNTKLAFILISLILVTAPLTWALAENPPSDLDDKLEEMVTKAYAVTFINRGWGSVYQLPQSKFSVDEDDFQDDSAEFGEVGFYAVGLNNLLNPQYQDIDLNASMETNLKKAAQSTLPWVWTPATESFGAHHQMTLPNKAITNVVEKIMGVNGASNTCKEDVSVLFNTWGVPKDTVSAQTTTTLSSIAGAGHLFLLAAEKDATAKDNYMKIATGAGDMLLSMIVTPDGKSYGIHPSALTDSYDNSVPVGMMPAQMLVMPNSTDTSSCSDGGTIKIQENRKSWEAQAAYFLSELGKETGESKYTDAAKLISESILSLQECDGSYKDYTRWEGPGNNVFTCTPDNGDEYQSYAANVTLAETKGFIIDTSTILYFLQKVNPTIYKDNSHYHDAVNYLLELEENDAGAGFKKNGSPYKYASYSLDLDIRPFAQLLLSNVLLRASCNETDSAVEKRLQAKAYTLITSSSNMYSSDLGSKAAYAISPDVGTNVLAASIAADNWKIITKGCKDCLDGDGDGYIDGVCAGDTKKYDCNDADAAIHPGASETCNMIDDDCDGKIDEDFDSDKDGVSICAEVVDCDDDNAEIYPGAIEQSDDQDNDCNGKIDDAGIFVNVQTDQNVGLENIDVLLIEYGNACANSFVSPADSIDDIKLQCSTIGSCTTDTNGSCFVTVKKDGKFQALAGVPGQGLMSNPLQYEEGKRVDVALFADSNELAPVESTTETQPNDGNPFTSNPYMMGGILIGILIVVGIGVVYLFKSGKFSLPKGKPPSMGNKVAKNDSTILTSAKMSKPVKSEMKLPKLSASGLAGKLVGGKFPSTPKIGNFPPKKNDGFGTPSKPKKLWKDV